MAERADRPGWTLLLFGAIAWAACAVLLSAQSARRPAGQGAAERPPDRALPAGDLPARGSPAGPDPTAAGVPATADAVIEQMARAAGVIFAGQVTAVRMPAGFPGEGVVEVEFRVDEAVKGPAAGSVYTLREWAGLWSAVGGGGRYRVGRRLLVFLYAPDKRGMSSPVRGLDGAVPLRGGGAAPGPDDAGPSAAEWLVDLRWVQTQALKTHSAAGPSGGSGPVPPRPISPEPVPPEPVPPEPVHPPIAYPPLAGRVGPEIEYARDAMANEPLAVRRAPIFVPMPQSAVAPTETLPLPQVIALCREAMRGSDGLR